LVHVPYEINKAKLVCNKWIW